MLPSNKNFWILRWNFVFPQIYIFPPFCFYNTQKKRKKGKKKITKIKRTIWSVFLSFSYRQLCYRLYLVCVFMWTVIVFGIIRPDINSGKRGEIFSNWIFSFYAIELRVCAYYAIVRWFLVLGLKVARIFFLFF